MTVDPPVTRSEFEKVKRRVYLFAIVAAVSLVVGALVILWSRTQNQHDIRRVSCANSQSLITQYEFFKLLAAQNPSKLSAAQVRERQLFYQDAETLAALRAGPTCATLLQMQLQAQRDIRATLKDLPAG